MSAKAVSALLQHRYHHHLPLHTHCGLHHFNVLCARPRESVAIGGGGGARRGIIVNCLRRPRGERGDNLSSSSRGPRPNLIIPSGRRRRDFLKVCPTRHVSHLTRSFHTTSTPNMSLVGRILANSVCVADKAAAICREIMASGDLGIVEKTGAADLQTQADRSVQDCIVGSLRANFPGLAVIGEEGDKVENVKPDWLVKEEDAGALKMAIPDEYASAKLEDITVWVDPLDGTKEYTEGLLDHVTVLIGIAVKTRAVAGVINQPYFNYKAKDPNKLGRTIYGVMGSGVHGIERTLPPADKRIVTTTRSHGTGLVNDCAEACKPTDIIRVGGAGHKVMLLIEGVAHAYVFPSPGCKRWDTCAPEAILHALGGKLTDIYGNYYDYSANINPRVNEWGTLATCEEKAHAEFLAQIPDDYKKQVKDYFKNQKKK